MVIILNLVRLCVIFLQPRERVVLRCEGGTKRTITQSNRTQGNTKKHTEKEARVFCGVPESGEDNVRQIGDRRRAVNQISKWPISLFIPLLPNQSGLSHSFISYTTDYRRMILFLLFVMKKKKKKESSSWLWPFKVRFLRSKIDEGEIETVHVVFVLLLSNDKFSDQKWSGRGFSNTFKESVITCFSFPLSVIARRDKYYIQRVSRKNFPYSLKKRRKKY
jgi:hypothetical protein